MKKAYFKYRIKPSLSNSICIFSVLIVFIALLTPKLWSTSKVRETSVNNIHVENSWVLEEVGKTGQKWINNNDYIHLEKNKLYKIFTHISYDGSNDEMPYGFLRQAHIFCRVLFDGKEIFRYMPQDVKKWDKARSPGFIHKDFPLPHDCKGKKLEIELLPVLNGNITYNVCDVSFGNYKSVMYSMMSRDLPHNILTILCMLLGFGALIFSTISLKGDDYREGIIIGLFALVLSLYSITECIINRYFIGNPYYLYFLNYCTFSLIPISVIAVMRECMAGTHRKICTYVIIAEVVLFAIELFLHFTGIKDMREVLLVVHVIDFSEILLITILLFSMPDNKRRLSLELQLLPITIGAIFDAFIYWLHLDLPVNDATFTILGILIFLFKELITKLVTQSQKISRMQQHTIEGMATLIESRDGSTGEHVKNTGVYSRMLALELYKRGKYTDIINSDFVDMIGRIAPLHDVGKIKISDTILNKPGKLTDEEYEIMKTHTELGGEIIVDILKEDLDKDLLTMAHNIAMYHHERWDGKGYPKGLKGEDIPLEARILSVADVFDALSSRRIYKDNMNIDEAFNELVSNENKQFQKDLVEVFVSLKPSIASYLQSQIQQNRNK